MAEKAWTSSGSSPQDTRTMVDEHTPLIATVSVARPRHRYPHHVVRRFCTIALSSCLLAGFVTFIILLIIEPPGYRQGHRHGHHRDEWEWSTSRVKDHRPTHQDVLDILFDTPSAEQAEDWSRYYTSGPHLAGKNFSQVSERHEEERFGPQSRDEDFTDLTCRPRFRQNGPRTNG